MKGITLTQQEMVLGCTVGLTRYAESISKNRKPRFPEQFPDQMLLFHQLGACAEVAFCKFAGLFYSPTVNKFGHPDIGDDIEVRWSSRDTLKVSPKDNNVYCISMSGNLPTFVYNGWIWSEEAKQKKWEADPGDWGKPAFFVPVTDLRQGKIERDAEVVETSTVTG
tara:strand:+ start:5150 stop:5647 length:498 start_codon:yes stop_codon:yes gene_type:complete